MWNVHVDKSVDRKLKKIPNPDKERIQNAIDILEYSPVIGRPGYRLRVVSWRLLMDMNFETSEIFVYMLGSRGDIYKQ